MNTSLIKNNLTGKITKNLSVNIKPQWKDTASQPNMQIFEECNINHNILGKLNISINKLNDGFNRWIIEVKNMLNKQLGIEVISMEKHDNSILGYNITVEPEYRKKGYKLGELLRLFSVMEMHKNNSPFIKIYSKNTAVYFHSKYKFIPCNKTFADRNRMLESIANDNASDFSDIAALAKQLLQYAKQTSNNAEQQRKLCIDANNLAIEYINRAIEKERHPEIKHSFFYGMDMILTKENVEKNKEFYNRLFEKYGIDYKI